jgi:MFS superfamily sulfate permease-like transporter
MVVAIFYILYNNYKKPFLFETDKQIGETGEIKLELTEDVTFLHKANIQRALNIVPDHTKVIIDGSKSINIDVDVLEIIDEFKINAGQRDIQVEVINRNFVSNKKKEHPIKSLERSVSLSKFESINKIPNN